MITIDLGSTFVTNLILLGLAFIGFSRGFRYMVSIALFTTIGYLLTVQGGNYIVGLINRIWSSLPRLLAFVTAQNPSAVDPLPAIIPDNLQAPLLLRVLVFIALLAVGIGYAWPWEGKPLVGFDFSPKDRPLRVLGLLTGLYVAVLLISAIAVFYAQGGALVAFSPAIDRALGGLPNYTAVVPSVIAAFFVLLVIIIIIRFDRVWRP
jgi:hypothetical protein